MRWMWLACAVTLSCSSYGGGASNGSGSATATVGDSSGGAANAGAGPDPSAAAGAGGISGHGLTEGRQALVWIWQSYPSSISAVAAHASSFTHVSPAFYQMNYAYESGALRNVNATGNYDGQSTLQLTQQIHAAGLKCVPLVYAGAGNNGVDDGIHNVLNDSPPGTQSHLINAMLSEARAKGYDGYNLDWEVGPTGYADYGTKLISFLATFKKALNQEGMQLSFDLGAWYVRQCADDGLVDLAQMSNSVDLMIMEDYSDKIGEPGSACPASLPAQSNCYADFTGQLQVMCNMPLKNVSIGVISPDSSAFAAQAFAAVGSYGFTGVGIWPSNGSFLGKDQFSGDQTWYSVFADFLAPNSTK